jgi:hypothetical protein
MIHGKPSACVPWRAAIVLSCLLAQSAGAWQLAPLSSKSSLSGEDIDQIRASVSTEIEQLETDLADSKAKAAEDFSKALLPSFERGTASFQQALATACGTLFAERIKSVNGRTSWILLGTLGQLKHPATLDGLREVSASPDAAVRALVMDAVAKMPSNLEADQVRLLADWLLNAGKRETSAIVLRRIYEAMHFDQGKGEQGQAVLDLLAHRLQKAGAERIAGEAAEINAIVRLSELRGALTNAEPQLVQAVAQLMTYATHRYLYDDLSKPQRINLQRLVAQCEALLKTVTGQPGELSSAMSTNTEDRHDKIRTEITAWVGSNGKAGKVGGRWQVPAGAGLNQRSFDANPDG